VVFAGAQALPAELRAAYLAEACGGNEALHLEVESLLASDTQAKSFLETPAVLLADTMVAVERGRPTRVGPYQIASRIGVGGMGEVYRARDARLGRDVAIKFLPRFFASNPDRLARFEGEARMLASLNHPHIGAIYGVEQSEGVPALILELVEGLTLADRLATGPIPLTESLEIARQIADALEAAHASGIVHRDLKPANVKITPHGVVKVLDFGLAKAVLRDDAARALSPGPLATNGDTRDGVILGTPWYMSPEQARGLPVDQRTDIWAFGCVLYEMLTGHIVFAGETVTDHIATILERDPDWTVLPEATPPDLRRVLRRCLARDPTRRLQAMGDARVEIDDLLSGGPHESIGARPAHLLPPGRRTVAWAVAGAAVAIGVAVGSQWRPAPIPPSPPETRTEIVTPATADPTSFALSPDGRQIVFVASGDGASRLWLRSLAATTAQPLAGTEGAASPFWSPDSRAIGFFAGGALKRLDLGGGAPQTLAPAPAARGGTWGADSVIVFAPTNSGSLMRVAATGGDAVPVTILGPTQAGRRWPHMLSDGRRFLFLGLDQPDAAGIYLGALDGSAPTRLTSSESAGVSLPGWLLWVRGGTLVAQRLDVEQAALTGDPVTLADGVAVDDFLRSGVSVASTGLVAYRMGATSQRQLTWVDRSGTARGTVGSPDRSNPRHPRVSPDGTRVAVSRRVQGNTDLWLMDGARTSRVTFDAALDQSLLWSPDGARIVFETNRTGPFDLYQTFPGGAEVEELVVASDQNKVPSSWSADGRFLLYTSVGPSTGADLWVVPMAGDDRTPSAFLKTPFHEAWGAFSPDGRWVAYQSNVSGPSEIYVRPFVPPLAAVTAAGPGPTGSQWPVSSAGGVFPLWRPDGKELYYLNREGAMMAATITVTGSTLAAGVPVVLFPTRILGGGASSGLGRSYDVAPDGRFLINTVLDVDAAPITVLMNWRPPAP
jgi:Tol biopolymer transport system component